jgi:hypothetical protein
MTKEAFDRLLTEEIERKRDAKREQAALDAAMPIESLERSSVALNKLKNLVGGFYCQNCSRVLVDQQGTFCQACKQLVKQKREAWPHDELESK